MQEEANLRPGDIVAVIEPRVEEVNPKTRKCTGTLQAFRVQPPTEHEQFPLALATGETPTKFLRLPGGIRLG